MKSAKSIWLGIEGCRDGYPLLWRVRRLDLSKEQRNGRPHLFVLTWLYNAHGPSLLPHESFYAHMKRFEEDALEKVEVECGATFVGTETGLGKSHYFFYAESIERLANFLDSRISSKERIEFSSKEDPTWEEYQRLIQPALKKKVKL